tara:strand:+ start:165 stop:824 length:660 start_codon:yes stop_codon:yes gene_type:complete
MSLYPLIMPVAISLPTVALTANAFDTANATVYTFSGKAFGDAAADRLMVVGIGAANNSNAISSVTIGGVSATETVTSISVAAENRLGMYQAIVPSGTTGDVVVTFAGAKVRCHIGVWRVTGVTAAASATDSDSAADPVATSLNVPANGICIGFCGIQVASSSWTWAASLTEVFDQGDTEGYTSTGASGFFETAVTPKAVSADPASAVNAGGLTASWQPA